MHVVTAMSYGIPPKRRPTAREKRKRLAKRLARMRVQEEQLDRYATALLEFRAWCEGRGLNFRAGVMRAVSLFRHLNRE